MRVQDTIAAVATPPGEGGIAVARVSGPQAFPIAGRVFRPQRGGDPASYGGYTVHYGAFADPATGEIADDGLLTAFRAPHSYTGEDVVELACHGGRLTTQRVLQAVLSAGARPAEPGEFTQRAFLNGKLDLAQAEAVADVIRARTEAARRMARRQMEGALSQAVAAIKDELVGILAAIEVTIDFSEEVGELAYAPLETRLNAALEAVERLLATAEQGRLLREGLRVAIVGRPNVGKSSLLNALLRAERAIVTPIAGTTRDTIEEAANIRGFPLVLVDTAGLRETEDAVERIGAQRAETAAAASDALLFVVDAMTGITPEDRALHNRLSAAENKQCVFLVANKRDAATPEQAESALSEARAAFGSSCRDFLLLSAQTGAGMDALEEALVSTIAGPQAGEAWTADAADSGLAANARQQQALEAARDSLQEARRTATQRLPGDFIAIDARGALDALGQITGETVTEDIIHRIFRDFCVGK